MTITFGALPAVGRRPYTADVQAVLDQFADDVNLAFANLPVVSGAALVVNNLGEVGWDYAAVRTNLGVLSTSENDAQYAAIGRQVIAGTGLAGGGALSADVTVSMPNTGTAGTYGDGSHVPQITTDAQGRITGVTAVAISGGGAVLSVNTRTGVVTGLAEASQIVGLLGNTGGWTLGTNTDIYLPSSSWSGGALTGGVIQQATTMKLGSTYTQTSDPTNLSVGTSLYINWNPTLNNTGAASQTGFFGPRGVIQTEGTVTWQKTSGFLKIAPVGYAEQLIQKNQPGSAMDIYGSWGIILNRIWEADGATVTLHGNDTAHGHTSIIDNGVYFTKNTGTIDGATHSFEHVGFLSAPCIIGNTTISRVAYDVADFSTGSGQVAIIGGQSWGAGADADAHSVPQNIGLRIQPLTHGVRNIGILSQSSVIVSDGTDAHGSTLINSGLAFGVPISGISVYANATDANPVVQIISNGGIGQLRFGPGAGSLTDFVIARTGTAAAAVTGTLTLPSPIFTSPVVSDGTFTISDGTAGHGKVFGSVSAIGPGFNLFANTADTQAAGLFAIVSGVPTLAFGPGGTTVRDVKIERTGTAAALATGVFTFASPVFTGAPIVTGGVFNVSDGTAGHGSVNLGVGGLGAAVQVFANTADTTVAAQLGATGLQIGPGGSTATDVKLLRTGAAAAAFTGVLTMTSPVINTAVSGSAIDTDSTFATGASTTVTASSAVKTALALKATLASPTFTGTVVLPSSQIITSAVLNTGVSGTAIDTDGTFTTNNSDTLVPSQKAVRTMVNTLAPLASPTFTGTIAATGGALNMTDGTAGHGEIVLGVTAFGPNVGLRSNSGDTTNASQLGATGIQMGPGGSTATDFKLLRTGTAAGAFTGTVTIPSPVISGHATIEGVTPTGATGTGKLVFDGTPTLVTPVIGAATGTSLAVTGAITSSGGGVGYATGAGTAVTQLTNKTTAFPTIGSHLCGTLTWNNAALASDTSVTSASSTATLIAATDIVCFTHISGGTIGAYTMTCTPSAGTWTLTLRNVHSGSLSEAPVFAFAIIKGVTS